MRSTLLFLSICLFSVKVLSQDIYSTIDVNGQTRTYMVHLPVGYNNSISYPLVLAFHGGQNGATQSQLGWQAIAYMSNLSQKSDAEGFIVVYPEGLVINGNRTWNAGACCPPAMNQNVDDVGFVNALIDRLQQDYPINPNKIYAAGSSNGAMLCFRLACELSERFAAIGTVSATQMFQPCNPTRKMPIINIHSYVDTAVLYNGGLGAGPSGVNFTSQDFTMDLWKSLNNCSTVTTVVNGNGTNFDFIKITNCACNVEFHQYNTTDGGHSWPGGNPNNNPVSYQINATDLIWSFFQNYTLGCPALNNSEFHQESPVITPNPFSDKLQIDGVSDEDEMELYNNLGQNVWSGKNISKQDFSFLTKGTYYLRTKFKTYKLLKI
jgi:polyhydroxybutyrate depolymerase